jgi:hypothetical protein
VCYLVDVPAELREPLMAYTLALDAAEQARREVLARVTAQEPTGGRILALTVCYEVDTPRGPQKATVDLEAMLRHCRPERVEDLLDDLTVLCEDVLAESRPSLAVVRRAT